MGLNFAGSNAQWSYSGFNRFRERLAQEIGINLRSMVGFAGNEGEGTPWNTVKDDIEPFLNHSDCDGEISPEQCVKIAPRLRALVSDWEDGHDKQNALELADDMERLAAEGKPLEFT